MLHEIVLILVALFGLPALWLAQVAMSGRPFTLLEAPGGFWPNLRNELRIDLIRFGELNLLGFRPGVLWGQVGAVGGGAVIDESFKAENDLSAKQYYIVEISGDNQVDVADGATDVGLGVLQNAPTAGQTALVRLFGRSKVSSDAALTAGNLIGPAADGQADAKTAGTDTTEYICGVVVRGSGAAGEMAEVIIGATPGRAA